MTQARIIDADGHVFEDAEAMGKRMPKLYRDWKYAHGIFAGQPWFPPPGQLHSPTGTDPPGAFGDGGHVGVEEWMRFMDATGMLILTLPVVFPAVIALGYDPIWFGIIVVKMAELCLITPPIGLNCFVVSGAQPQIPPQDVFRGVFPFFYADLAAVGVLIAFPDIVTWLPSLILDG